MLRYLIKRKSESSDNLPVVPKSKNSDENKKDSATNVDTVTKSELPEFDPTVINRIILKNYPKTDSRSFQSKWFDRFNWLEYHPQKDACLCYACRTFGTTETKEVNFRRVGFRNWKHAMDKGNGLVGHDESTAHKLCMVKWNQHKFRVSQNEEVSTLLNDEVLTKYRYYVSSIFDVLKFLVVHELPTRGSYDKDQRSESGLFQALFQYTLSKDKTLVEYAKIIPKNASYTSPEIQNDMIDIMARCVKDQISVDVNNADVPFYCLMADGTRDRSNIEAVSIVLRFIRKGVPIESLLSIEQADQLNAEYLSKLILKTLNNNNINPEHMLSQCYDGAVVMKGWKRGVQALIENELNRTVPYVHCFNHQLHLIIVDLVKNISDVKQYFDYCKVIHKIFSTFKFKSYYDGKRTSRLLEQRWSGHLKVTDIILNNYNSMIEALKSAISNENDDLDGITMVECTGLLTIMKSQLFRFLLCTMFKVLKTIEPADKILQSRESGLANGLPVIRSVHTCIKDCRSDLIYDQILNQSKNLLPNAEDNDMFTSSPPEHTGNKRKRKSNERLKNFVLSESSGQFKGIGNNSNLKLIYFEILDKVIAEFDERFFKHTTLFNVIDMVYNFSFENISEIDELKKINSNIKIPSQEEIICIKKFLKQNNILKENYLKELYKQKIAFKDTYELYAAVATFACSSATCESTFSCLNRIDTPYRQSMLFGRESNLTLLPFEKKKVEAIDINTFLRLFHEKSRRLPLY